MATLRDALLPIVDTIRGIPVIFGLRPHITLVLIRTWSGERPGIGTFIDTTVGLKVSGGLGFVKVRNVQQHEVIASGGLYTDQDLIVGPITPPYQGSATDNDSIALFDPPTTANATEIHFNIQGPGYSLAGDWFKKIAQRTDQSFRYMLWIRKTGEIFQNTATSLLISITVTPSSLVTALGTIQYTATGTYKDSSTRDITTIVTWTSTSTSIATISNSSGSNGLATLLAVNGTTTIKAAVAVPAISGSTSLTYQLLLLSIAVTPINPSVMDIFTQQFVATGTFNDGTMHDITSSVTWASLNTAVATISAGGLATPVSDGATTMTATDPSTGIIGSTGLTVTPVTLPAGAALVLDPLTVMGSEGTILPTWGVATQATPSLRPFPDSKNAGGGASVVFGGGPYQVFGAGIAAPTPTPTRMSIPSTALSIPFWLAFEFELNGGNPGTVTHQIPLELSADISSQVGVMVCSSQTSAGGIPSIQVRGPSGLMTIDINQTQSTLFQWAEDDLDRLVEVICDGTKTGTVVKINGVVQTVTVGGVDPGTGSIATVGTIGSKHDGTASATMAVALLAWWNRLPTGNDSPQFYAYVGRTTNRLADRRNNFAQHYQFLSFGDSIEAWNVYGPPTGRTGANLGPRYYPISQQDASPNDFSIATALGGATLSTSGPGFSSSIRGNYDALKGAFVSGLHYLVSGDGGINDIAIIFQPSDSPSAISAANTIIALMQAFVAHVISDLSAVFSPDGHDIGVRTIVAGFDASFVYFEQCRLLVNAGYRAAFANNAGGSGSVRTHVDDLGADTFMGTQTGRQVQAGSMLYFGSDGLHPSFAGTRRSVGIEMAQMAASGLITAPAPAANVAPLNLLTTVSPVLWTRGDQGITTVSGKVSEWDDQGGRGYQLFETNAGKRPTFSATGGGSTNKPYLLFTGNSGFILKCPAFFLKPPFSYFFVCDNTTAVGGQTGLDFVGDSFTCTFPQQITIASTGASQFPIPFGWHIYEVQCPASGNGVLIVDNGSPSVGTGPGITANALTIGSSASDPGNNSWSGGIGELLIVDGIVGSSERTNVTRSLGTYWGISVP